MAGLVGESDLLAASVFTAHRHSLSVTLVNSVGKFSAP